MLISNRVWKQEAERYQRMADARRTAEAQRKPLSRWMIEGLSMAGLILTAAGAALWALGVFA